MALAVVSALIAVFWELLPPYGVRPPFGLPGAAGEGDIGQHFPPGDPATKGIDSRELLTRVVRLVVARGYRVHNVDATVIAERPRLSTHIAPMRESIARCLGIASSCVNVKATTHERFGSLGSGEALAALAVALIEDADA